MVVTSNLCNSYDVTFQMPRGKDDMQVNVAGLRRNIKNLAHNYSDAQVPTHPSLDLTV